MSETQTLPSFEITGLLVTPSGTFGRGDEARLASLSPLDADQISRLSSLGAIRLTDAAAAGEPALPPVVPPVVTDPAGKPEGSEGDKPEGDTSGDKSETHTTPLPEGFPASALLVDNGFGTLEAVRFASDEALIAVKGIGPKLLAEIRAEQG